MRTEPEGLFRGIEAHLLILRSANSTLCSYGQVAIAEQYQVVTILPRESPVLFSVVDLLVELVRGTAPLFSV